MTAKRRGSLQEVKKKKEKKKKSLQEVNILINWFLKKAPALERGYTPQGYMLLPLYNRL